MWDCVSYSFFMLLSFMCFWVFFVIFLYYWVFNWDRLTKNLLPSVCSSRLSWCCCLIRPLPWNFLADVSLAFCNIFKDLSEAFYARVGFQGISFDYLNFSNFSLYWVYRFSMVFLLCISYLSYIDIFSSSYSFSIIIFLSAVIWLLDFSSSICIEAF